MSRIGGWAGIGAAITYLVGFALAGTLLASTVDMSTSEYVRFLVDNEAVMYAWSLIIYVLNGALLVALAIAIYDRLAPRAPDLARIGAAFGLIWAGLVIATGMLRLTNLGAVVGMHASDPATAASMWPALEAIEEGLGGGVEVPGGLWVLLVSIAGLRTKALPRHLNELGIGNGIAGILTLVPGVELFAAVFGLGMLGWFAWVGIVLVRDSRRESHASGLEPTAEVAAEPAAEAHPNVVANPAA